MHWRTAMSNVLEIIIWTLWGSFWSFHPWIPCPPPPPFLVCSNSCTHLFSHVDMYQLCARLNICCCSLTHIQYCLTFPLNPPFNHPSIVCPLTISLMLSKFVIWICLNPAFTTIHLIVILCHPSLSLHVPSNYRAQYHSFDRLSISSICPDYCPKIKKIAMDQSK